MLKTLAVRSIALFHKHLLRPGDSVYIKPNSLYGRMGSPLVHLHSGLQKIFFQLTYPEKNPRSQTTDQPYLLSHMRLPPHVR